MCPINKHLRSIYRRVKNVIIRISVMPLFNHYILTLHNHGVITILRHLQIFPIPTNRIPTCIIRSDSFVWRRPLELVWPSAWPLDVFWGLRPGWCRKDLRSDRSSAIERGHSFLQNEWQRCWRLYYRRRSMRRAKLRRGIPCGLHPACPTIYIWPLVLFKILV
jgi:hypothetical protein